MQIIGLFKLFHQTLIEAVRMQDILVFYRDIDDTSRDLILGNLKSQDLLVRERELVENDNIAVAFLERLATVQCVDRLQLDGLTVGGLGLLLVGQLDTDLVNIILDLRIIVEREVKEEIVTDSIDVVHHSTDAVLVLMNAKVLTLGTNDSPGVACHHILRHTHVRVVIASHF